MNIYDAIMAAANHIERNPSQFKFSSVLVPEGPECGTPGCALGWIGTFAGVKHPYTGSISLVASIEEKWDTWGGRPFLPETTGTFYARMDALAQTVMWRDNATLCAQTMRAYAEKYHRDERPAPLRSDSELVSELLAKVTKQTISAEAQFEELAW